MALPLSKRNKRKLLQLVGALALGTLFSLAQAWEAEPFSSHDLYRDARLSEHNRLPVLLLFSADYCGFCARVMEEFLIPMHRSGEYRDKVLIRELKIDGYESVRDFDNQPTMPEDLAYRYNISVTPTILFLDHRGKELTRRMVGLGTVDFFGLYLDAAIDSARTRLLAQEGS